MRSRWVLPFVVALHLLLRLAIWMRPLRELGDLVIPDDTFLSLHLARSIAHGLGPHYGLAPTNGFQPLYVFLMAPVFAWTGADPLAPVRVALLLLIVADALAMALTLVLARRLGCSRPATFMAGLMWALSAYSLRSSLNGLETSIAAAAIAAVLLVWHRLRSGVATPRAWASFGALAGIAYLARIDTLILLPPLALSLLVGNSPGLRAATWRGLALAGAVAVAVAVPWLLYSWHWTHSLFPISGRAVRYTVLSPVHHAPTWSNTYAHMMARTMRALGRGLLVPAVLTLALALATLVASGRLPPRLGARLRELWPLGLFGVTLVAAYTLWFFGPWYFSRYYYPLWIPAVLVFGVALDELLLALSRALPRHRAAALATAGFLIVCGSAADPIFRALVTPGPPPEWGYLRIGEWARDHFAPGTVIGGPQSGALGYFADQVTVVNLDGVVNRDCYEAMRAGRMLQYVRGVGIRYLVVQDDIGLIADETRDIDPGALTHLGTVPGIHSWGGVWELYRVEPAR